ncbi:NAD(P)-dependent oxidoreductase [Mumia sp. zg.B53]|uniref:NAD-dependent epimerase/dehydratase family protein n=1 Tax=Mumia sp. zg.B53 TaxID=2855449 RepID=UPI001C6F12B6|nr:NAD(P)-dependent oxidoreductase [Mumia sp. zg.B53]MBW9214089.1 NAD(P)-dependent oxidoreductase [Mumia sp. zg.B53]
MTTTWVIGASGLVGSAVLRAAARSGDRARGVVVPWARGPDEQVTALRSGVHRAADESGDGGWTVVWVAGAGVVGTQESVLAAEATVFSAFADELVRMGDHGPRALFVASSAGGVYAGSEAPPFTEDTPEVPLAPYGRHKLEIEAITADLVRRSGLPTMVGRLTNVYGPGQNLAKAQGLVSQLVKASLVRRPLSLYVPLDTTRDYVFADDCAKVVLRALALMSDRERTQEPVIKIIGSGRPVTIATLLDTLHRILKRRPPVVLGDSPSRRFQVRDLRMRSTRWTQLDSLVSATLPEGIASTVDDVGRRLRAQGPAALSASIRSG